VKVRDSSGWGTTKIRTSRPSRGRLWSKEMGEKKVVLVTGGSGLVGSAIREVIEETKPEDEEWIFASSKVRRRPRLGEKEDGAEHECGDVTVRKKRSGGEARRTPHARA